MRNEDTGKVQHDHNFFVILISGHSREWGRAILTNWLTDNLSAAYASYNVKDEVHSGN